MLVQRSFSNFRSTSSLGTSLSDTIRQTVGRGRGHLLKRKQKAANTYLEAQQERSERRRVSATALLQENPLAPPDSPAPNEISKSPLVINGKYQGEWINWFDGVIYIAVIVNSLQLGLEMDFSEPKWVFVLMDRVCFAIFVLEIVAKYSVLTARYFFADGWNVFSLILVIINILDYITFGMGSFNILVLVRIIRLVRIARILRCFQIFKELTVIFSAVMSSMRTVMWFVIFLLTLLYAGALVCVMFVQETVRDNPSYPPLYPGASQDFSPSIESFNPYLFFGSVPDAMYTLFNLVIMLEFNDFGRAIFLQQKLFFVFFIVFITFGTFGLLNILVCTMMESTLSCARGLEEDVKVEAEIQRAEDMIKLTRLLGNERYVAAPKEGHLTPGSKPYKDIMELMHLMKFPVKFTPDEMFTVFGGYTEEDITLKKFRTNALRLGACDGNPFEWHCQALLIMNRILEHVQNVEHHLLGVSVASKIGAERRAKRTMVRKTTFSDDLPDAPQRRRCTIERKSTYGAESTTAKDALESPPQRPFSPPQTIVRKSMYAEDSSPAGKESQVFSSQRRRTVAGESPDSSLPSQRTIVQQNMCAEDSAPTNKGLPDSSPHRLGAIAQKSANAASCELAPADGSPSFFLASKFGVGNKFLAMPVPEVLEPDVVYSKQCVESSQSLEAMKDLMINMMDKATLQQDEYQREIAELCAENRHLTRMLAAGESKWLGPGLSAHAPHDSPVSEIAGLIEQQIAKASLPSPSSCSKPISKPPCCMFPSLDPLGIEEGMARLPHGSPPP